MARYALNLPAQLKREAELLASEQGVSLNQFILWSVSEKVGGLKESLDDPRFPQISYRRGGSGIPQPTIRGTGIRVQTVVIAAQQWQMAPDELAEAYTLTPGQVQQALAFLEYTSQWISFTSAVAWAAVIRCPFCQQRSN